MSEVSLRPDSSNRGLFVPIVAGEALLTYRLSSSHVLPRFGDMVYVKVPQGKGCGFVQYVERRSAEQALAAMHGQVKRNSGSTFCAPCGLSASCGQCLLMLRSLVGSSAPSLPPRRSWAAPPSA